MIDILLKNELIHELINAQKIIFNRVKLYIFSKSSINHFINIHDSKCSDYNFENLSKKFNLVEFKDTLQIEKISYQKISEVGNDFVNHELIDSMFVLNIATFETCLMNILKKYTLCNPDIILKKRKKNEQEKQININTIFQYSKIEYLHELIRRKRSCHKQRGRNRAIAYYAQMNETAPLNLYYI